MPPVISDTPTKNIGIVVVIPCYDEPHLENTLFSLLSCTLPPVAVEVLVVINAPANATKEVLEQNKKSLSVAKEFSEKYSNSHLRFYFIENCKLPQKHAGVGLARKIGMDEAAYRFTLVNNLSGLIVCLDADCTCEKNYFLEVYQYFKEQPKCHAASLYFEHPLNGTDFENRIYKVIAAYELHLRYYKQALKWAGFPFAFHTIGSCMAVRAEAYMQQGGMNKRKAGEDFYFLHKHIPLGNFGEINTTCVYPSPRPSHRVPFGTGKTIGRQLLQPNELTTYNLLSFSDLKFFFKQVNDSCFSFSTLPISVQKFIPENEWQNKLYEFEKNSGSQELFLKRFYLWFDAFKVLKFLYFARESFFTDVPISTASKELLMSKGVLTESKIIPELLCIYRNLDRG